MLFRLADSNGQIRRLLRMTKPPAALCILDFGAGRGRLDADFAARAKQNRFSAKNPNAKAVSFSP
jgi:hypothetical protein